MSLSKGEERFKRVVALVVAFAVALTVIIPANEGCEVNAEGEVGQITNYEVLRAEGAGPKVVRNLVQENERAIYFTIDGVRAVEETGRGIYSVKVEGGSEYFYTGETITSSTTTPGVYYSDGRSGSLAKGYYFVYPDGDKSKNIQVQVLDVDAAFSKNFSINKSSFSGSAGTWITDASLKSELDSMVNDNASAMYINYTDYSGVPSRTLRPGTSNSTTTFSTSLLSYYVDSVSAERVDIKIYYGSKYIGPASTLYSSFIKIGSALANSPGFGYNTNAYKLNANMPSKDYLAVLDWCVYSDSNGATGIHYSNSNNSSNYVKGSGSTPDNASSLALIPDEGVYLPLSASSSKKNYLKIRSASYADNQAPAINGAVTTIYGAGGPNVITYNSLNVGQNVGVDDADLFKTMTVNASKGERVLGEITSVGGKSIGASFSDDYITITPSGNITVKKGSSKALTYKLVTKTPYTKFRNESGSAATKTEPVIYDSGSSASPSSYTLGYQTWNVTLTISAIKGEGAEDTTEATTTEAETTAEASTTENGTTTETSTTAVDGTTESATTNVDSTTGANATTETPVVISPQPEVHADDLGNVTISKITSKKLKLTVKWNEVAGADGYEVYIANSKAFTNYERAAVVSNKTSCVIKSFNCKKLKKGKKYFIMVRPFKGAPVFTTTEDGYTKVCKKKGKMNIVIPSNPEEPNLRSTKIQISTSETSGFKTVATVKNTLRRKCTVTVKKYKSKKLKKGKTYYIKLIRTIDTTPKEYGDQSTVKGCKCKK